MKTNILKKIFNIRQDEYKKAKYLSAFFFAIGFYFTFISSISISVFDMRLGAKYLPFILFIFPMLNIVFSFVYMKVLPRISKRVLFRYFIFFVFLYPLFEFFNSERFICIQDIYCSFFITEHACQ